VSVACGPVEHSVETRARAQAVWRLWADVERWPEWNAGVERIELRGPFAVGSTILMTPPGDEPVELRIAETIEPELFVDEADGDDFVVRTTPGRGRRRRRFAHHLSDGDHGTGRRNGGPGDRSRDQR
jgi:hypothetical protein